MQLLLPEPAPTTDAHPVRPLRVLVWADGSADALVEAANGPGRSVRIETNAATAAHLASRGEADLMIAQGDAALEAFAGFLRVPLILVLAGGRRFPQLEERAYSVGYRASSVGLMVDQFVEHRTLAQAVAARREPPRACARCGRAYDPRRLRGHGTARRFVRFGSVSLCGACVDALRKLLVATETPYVEAEPTR